MKNLLKESHFETTEDIQDVMTRLLEVLRKLEILPKFMLSCRRELL
jgi:hypothetical protein